jgi:hypothetical protein
MPALVGDTLPQSLNVPRCFVPSPRLVLQMSGTLDFRRLGLLTGVMTPRFCCLGLLLLAVSGARADLTLVQTLDAPGAPSSQVTIMTKGDKMRIDTTPQISTIVDSKTGEIVTLMRDQKCAVRISAEKMKAASEMINKFTDKNAGAEKAKPRPTGRKETIRGYEAEEYAVDGGFLKASYWLAPTYPDGAAILRQLQAIKPEVWSSANPGGPSFQDFPALPIRTVVDMGGTKLTTELVSAKQDPVPDSAFAIPADYREVKGPELSVPGGSEPATGPSPR